MQRLKIENFRNLKNFIFEPHPGVNIIYGDNAQGKTNLLEAIWLFSGGKSFRGSKDKQFICFETPYFRNEIIFEANQRIQTAALSVGEKKVVTLNEIHLPAASSLAGKFACVIFAPNHLSIIKDGPAARRFFLDTAICQSKPAYVGLLYQYKKVLLQKNAVCKDSRYNSDLYDMLDIYDTQLAQLNYNITQYRLSFLQDLAPICSEFYHGLSSKKETLTLSLQNSFLTNNNQKEIFTCLKKARSEDIKSGFSTVGIHRDDLNFYINDLDTKLYGSQGQQRSVALCLKLAEGKLMEKYLGEAPIMLLDDVMSELDESRQDFILNQLGQGQVFITCCDHSHISRLIEGKTYFMKDGVLT